MLLEFRHKIVFHHCEDFLEVTLVAELRIEFEKADRAHVEITVEAPMDREDVLTQLMES